MIAAALLTLPLGLFTHPLFTWVKTNGYLCDSIAIAEHDGMRGLCATADIAEGEVILTLPPSLQLGVDSAGPLTGLVDATPPELWIARLGLALCAEKKRGADSPFAPYIDALPDASELPCLLAPESPGGYGHDATSEAYDAKAALAAWPPTAERATGIRRALRKLHMSLEQIAAATDAETPSLADLGWAASSAGSRAYRVRGAVGDSGGDEARFLPIVDLANYAPAGTENARVLNAPRIDTDNGSSPPIKGASDDPCAVSLIACKDIPEGAPILCDYNGGSPLSNERLLLEYGFVLKDRHDDELNLPFGAIAVGLEAAANAYDEDAKSPSDAAEEAFGGVNYHQARLLRQLGDVESSGLVFLATGKPSPATFALALILTARRPAELAEAKAVDELVASCGKAHAARANTALGACAKAALEELDKRRVPSSEGLDGFDAAADAFCETRRKILSRAVETTAAAVKIVAASIV